MTVSSDDTPTGPVYAATGPDSGARGQLAGPPPAAPDSIRKRNLIRDLTAATLLIAAALFPWNLYFGLGVPDSKQLVFVVLGVVTLLSLISLAVSYVGPWKLSGAGVNSATAGRVRLALNVPYLLLVLGFIVFDAFESVRFGGTVHVPGGVGPGAWLGVAGALLSAQPPMTRPVEGDDGHYGKWLRTARLIGYASIFGAALSSGFNLSWRIRYALRGSEFGTQNITVIVTAVVYGAVAFVAVVVASRCLLKGTKDARLTTLAFGVSSLVAGIIVWLLPVGREIDAFHSIAQNTSTAGVGYEGYLAWAAAAAIFAPLALFRSGKRIEKDVWRAALRNGLLLIAVWALGSMLMRLTSLIVDAILKYPRSIYDSTTLAVFDLITAALALSLFLSLRVSGPLRRRLVTLLAGFVFGLTLVRIILGVLLAPRFDQSSVAVNPVYGNNLAVQITSTFDVALCGLALCIFLAIILRGRSRRAPRPPQHPRRPRANAPAPRPAPGPAPGSPPPPTRGPVGAALPSEARTTQFQIPPRGDDAATRVLSVPGGAPRIFRPGPPRQQQQQPQQPRPKIFRPPPPPPPPRNPS
ncbi:hypothetical protein MBOU_04290 [Mycobacterium bourgelatii]|uniref:DUF7937 domain-containing protein n=1 Tax=Mycobacterium bourgelatii TaxID=1273442 RepID=A0A7I9YI97_MYCBU|nr:hypothetical protein MBOU_04290 [Mycobacterium bourgelatii]